MQLSERKLGGSTGITYGVEQNDRILMLRSKIVQKMSHRFDISMSEIIGAMLDAEKVETGQYKEAWEDIPEQMGKPRPADWVPRVLGDVTMEEVLGYPWGSRRIEGITRERVEELVDDANFEEIFTVRRSGSFGSRSARVSQKQKERLQILRKARALRKVTDVIAYLLDRAGIEYGIQSEPRARAITMLEGEVMRMANQRALMEDMPSGSDALHTLTGGEEAEEGSDEVS